MDTEHTVLHIGDSLADPLLPSQKNQLTSNEGRLTLDTDPNNQEANVAPYDEGFSSEYYSFDLYQGNIRNVRRILAATWFGFFGRTIWNQSSLPILIYLLNPKQIERVGYFTAVMGIIQVVFTTFTKHCLLRFVQRNCLFQVAAALGTTSIVVTMNALLYNVEYTHLFIGISMWSSMWGIIDATMPQLFAESLPELKEELYYTRASRVVRSSNILGALVTLLVFYSFLGNKWTIYSCSVAMIIGLCLSIPMTVLLCSLHDLEESNQLNTLRGLQVEDTTIGMEGNALGYPKRDEDRGNETEETAAITALLDSSERSNEYQGSSHAPRIRSHFVLVPLLITASNILSGVAAGLSIRYFPVFLAAVLHLRPALLQILFLAVPIGQAITKGIVRATTTCCAPLCVALSLKMVFVALLGSMVYGHSLGVPVWAISLLFLAQSFLTNSTTALMQSIMRTSLPESNVNKWAAAESLELLMWSVGAYCGGLVVKSYGVMGCFYATCCVETVACLPLLTLFCVGSSEEDTNSNYDSGPRESTCIESDFQLFPSGLDEFHDIEDQVSIDNSDSSSSSSASFFSCGSRQNTVNSALSSTDAIYDSHKRCCTYRDGTPAHVPAGERAGQLPRNYLEVCRGNRSRAGARWLQTQKWRKEEDLWKIHTIPSPWYLRIKEAYPHFIHGFTRQGHVVIYERPGHMKLKQIFRNGCTVSDMTRWYTFFMEYLSNCVVDKDRNGDWGFVVVMDMKEAGVSLLSTDLLSYLKEAGSISSSHYPMRMKRSILVHAGYLVPSVWGAVRKVLPDTLHTDILKSTSGLREYIDDDQIPQEYGGGSLHRLGEHPDELALRRLAESISESKTF